MFGSDPKTCKLFFHEFNKHTCAFGQQAGMGVDQVDGSHSGLKLGQHHLQLMADQKRSDLVRVKHAKPGTLDTGRNFPETYSTWSRTLERYRQPIETFAPQAATLERLLAEKGPNSFYESVENRKECCHIRKVEPLGRALQGQQLWVTGIRAEQSPNRLDMASLEWDAAHQLLKFHPLFDWTSDQVRDYVGQHNIPYNALHDQGFVSIGCAPCTRAIQPGEDFRAGRWWWEDASKKECGLHDVHRNSVPA